MPFIYWRGSLLDYQKKGKKVIFIDELPWMDTHKSNFVRSLDHFWNGWATTRRDIVLIICGSATSWIIDNVIMNYGGLHNRLTNHMNDFMVLMQQWENVQKYIQTADNASGESIKKYEAYQQSLSGRIEGFKNQFQELSTTIANDNAISVLIDSGTTLLNILTQIEANAGVIPLIFGGTAVVKAVKNFDKSNDFVLYGCESIVA